MMTRNYSAGAMTSLVVALTSCGVGQSLTVASRQSFIPGRTFLGSTRKRPSPMKMYIDDVMSFTSMDIPSLSSAMPLAGASVTSKPLNIFCTATNLIRCDPKLEAELLTDVSHVALDASTFLSPNTAWLRLCNVIGRVLILTSEYLQNDQIAPEEWAFQAFFLAVSTHMFLSSAWPLLLAVFSISTLTVRDRRAYALLFEAVGLSVLQFKTLLASRTVDWVEYPPSQQVELDGEYLYFLYSGEAAIPATVHKSGDNRDTSSIVDNTEFSDESLHIGTRIFGDVQFAKALEASLYKKSNKKSKATKSSMNQDTTNSTLTSQGSFVVGSNGASMLRISTSKLLQLMRNDNELSSSIQRLVLLCMQEKLSKKLEEGGLKSSSKKNGSSIKSSSTYSGTPNATYTTPTSI